MVMKLLVVAVIRVLLLVGLVQRRCWRCCWTRSCRCYQWCTRGSASLSCSLMRRFLSGLSLPLTRSAYHTFPFFLLFTKISYNLTTTVSNDAQTPPLSFFLSYIGRPGLVFFSRGRCSCYHWLRYGALSGDDDILPPFLPPPLLSYVPFRHLSPPDTFLSSLPPLPLSILFHLLCRPSQMCCYQRFITVCCGKGSASTYLRLCCLSASAVAIVHDAARLCIASSTHSSLQQVPLSSLPSTNASSAGIANFSSPSPYSSMTMDGYVNTTATSDTASANSTINTSNSTINLANAPTSATPLFLVVVVVLFVYRAAATSAFTTLGLVVNASVDR